MGEGVRACEWARLEVTALLLQDDFGETAEKGNVSVVVRHICPLPEVRQPTALRFDGVCAESRAGEVCRSSDSQ